MRYLCLTTRSQLVGDADTWWSRMIGDRTSWGPGLDGWDDSRTPDENLRARYGESLEGFDALFLSFSYTFSDPYNQMWPAPTRAVLGDKPAVGFVHEMRSVIDFVSPVRAWLVDASGCDVLLYPYNEAELDPYYAARELARARGDNPRLANQHIARIPHHVRTDLYYPEGERDLDVLLVGRVEPTLYDLRMRWAKLIAEGRLGNGLHVAAPYGSLPAYRRADRLKIQTEFTTLLRRARIVLTCSSHWRYMLQKMTEIPASGAFLVGDAPANLPDVYFDNMGVVSNEMTDDELVSVVHGWLRDGREREARAARLSAYVRAELAMPKFWDHVDDAVHAWQRGYRSGSSLQKSG